LKSTLKPDEPSKGRTTIASLLRSQGYRTHMVGKWHLGFEERGYDKPLPGGPVDRGFDSFFGIRASTDIPPYFYIRNNVAVEAPTGHIAANNSEGWSPIQGAFWREGGIAPNLALEEVLPRFTEEALEVIQQAGGQSPFSYISPSPRPIPRGCRPRHSAVRAAPGCTANSLPWWMQWWAGCTMPWPPKGCWTNPC
jgi:hypothetical protein